MFNPVDQRLNQNNNNYDNISERNKNIHNKIVTSINNFSIQGERNIDSQKFSPNKEISNNCEISNIQKEQIMENNEIIKEDKKDNNDKNIKRKLSSIKGKNKSKSKKSKEEKENKSEKEINKNNKSKKEKYNYIVNNMVALKSGNFAISIKRRVEIYNFKKLQYHKK